MHIDITSRRHQLSEPLREYVERKISKLEKYAHGNCEAHVVLERNDNDQFVEITFHGLHKVLHGSDRGENVRTCIDKAVSKVEAQLRKEKDKHINQKT